MAKEPKQKPAPYICTTGPAISGYFAVMMWYNDTGEYNLPPFWEPYQTGVGRYATREEAIAEAKDWAEAEGLEYQKSSP